MSDGLGPVLNAHRAELFRFLAARCGNADEAEDLFQELWIKATSTTGGPIGNARAYLFRMANNLVLDRRRSSLRSMRRDQAWLDHEGEMPVASEDRPDPAPQADEELARKQELQFLRDAVDALPEGAGKALRLHKLEGHGQSEVAAIMGISRSGVEKHLVVAMKHLRRAFADCGFSFATTSREKQTPEEGALMSETER